MKLAGKRKNYCHKCKVKQCQYRNKMMSSVQEEQLLTNQYKIKAL